MPIVKVFPLSQYLQMALERAEYESDENGVIVARVPGVASFFSQGETLEEARENLRDAIEGNLSLALQLGLPIPAIEGILVEEQDVQACAA